MALYFYKIKVIMQFIIIFIKNKSISNELIIL